MSTRKDREDKGTMSLVEKIEELQAQVAEMGVTVADRDGVIASLNAQIEEMQAENAKQMEAAEAAMADALASIAGKDERIVELEASVADGESNISDLEGELEAARAALQNPAFADAAARGEEEPVDVESDAIVVIEDSHLDKYLELQNNPQTRGEATAYWNQNEQAINDEIRERSVAAPEEDEQDEGVEDNA